MNDPTHLKELLESRRRVGLIFQGCGDNNNTKSLVTSQLATIAQQGILHYTTSAAEFKAIFCDTKLTNTEQIIVVLATATAEETKMILKEEGMQRRIQMTIDLDQISNDDKKANDVETGEHR